MREWNLKPDAPLSLVLAADARLGPTNYCDDQIWELSIGGGDPPAIALQTTFGLRARILRLFPRFTIGDVTHTDPTNFARPVSIHRFYPNFLSLSYTPFPNIDVESEYWVPQSQCAAGRLQITNSSSEPCHLQLEWVGQLTPKDGQRMAPVEIQAAPVLSGFTDGLAPIVFLTGGPQPGSGSYPSLAMDMELQPGETRQLTWTHAALATPEESFNLARGIAARKWDAERAKLELLNAGQIDIYTGDVDWDAAFALTQKIAFGLFLGPSANLSHPSFVISRQPDQGYSLTGEGSDYNHLWNGQTPLETLYMANLILPSAPQLVEGLLRNFLAIQGTDGFVDWKPGLAGQRSRLLATPLLATLAWRIYEITQDRDFLQEIFPSLLDFLHTWFTPQRDRDGDGIPEWDHPMQSGAEEHPLFSHWYEWSQGVEIDTAESPALCAFLYREIQTLIHIANVLERSEPVPALNSMADQLKTAIETSWDQEDSCYHYWDRDTHYSTRSEALEQRIGPGEILIQRAFEHPVRLLVRIQTNGETTRHPHLFIHGTSASGNHRVEHVTADQFKWYLGQGTITGEYVYSSLERIVVEGIDPDDQVNLFTAGYYNQDHTLLLPLWAEIPEANRAQELVERTITNPLTFWQPFGIPACVQHLETNDPPICHSVNLPWNTLIAEGLLQYGYQEEAADLVMRIMSGVIQTLKRDKAFRRYYHSTNGMGIGDQNALNGLAPIGLFLEVLGVRLISPQRVAIAGYNPFPWPVTVKYRGMTVLRQKEKTMIIFPDGQTVAITDPTPQIISLELEKA